MESELEGTRRTLNSWRTLNRFRGQGVPRGRFIKRTMITILESNLGGAEDYFPREQPPHRGRGRVGQVRDRQGGTCLGVPRLHEVRARSEGAVPLLVH